ncbi:unnamed protein product [Urochloa humidicola]
MAKGTRRQNHKQTKAKRRGESPARPTSVHDLPDELLILVLHVLSSSLHLVCPAAMCRRWRRAIADSGFFACFRSLNGAPCVAGQYYVSETLPPYSDLCRQVPEKLTTFVPVLPAVVDASHFSLDFFYVPPGDGDLPHYMCTEDPGVYGTTGAGPGDRRQARQPPPADQQVVH